MLGRARKRSLVCVALAGVSTLGITATASALTLGSVAPPNMGGCTNCEVMQLQVAAGEPKYRVPAGPTGFWTITSWSTQGGGVATGQARLRVYRKVAAPGQYVLLRQSALGTVPAHSHPSFATSLNVQKGDLLGLGTIKNVVSAYNSGVAGDNVETIHCFPTGPGQLVGPGTSCPFGALPYRLANVSATL